MNEIKIVNNQEFMGINIPVIEGGFGENQKVILAKTIAEIHNVELKRINELINKNIDEFEEGIDIIDLKGNKNFEDVSNDHGLYTQNALNRSSNIYILSEQGYMALVGLMKTDKAKEIRKKLRREYFAMRKVIQDNESLQAQLLLSIYKGGQEGVIAAKQLTELEKQPLLETIEVQKPKVEYCEKVLNPDTENNKLITMTSIAKDLGMSAQKLNKILHGLGIIYKKSGTYYLYNKYQKMIPEYFDYVINEYGQTLKSTEKGRQFILDQIDKILFGKQGD